MAMQINKESPTIRVDVPLESKRQLAAMVERGRPAWMVIKEALALLWEQEEAKRKKAVKK